MAMTVHVDVVSAEESIYSGEAYMIAATTEVGEVGIYPRHAPLLAKLKPGELRIRETENGEPQRVFISGGILEVQPHLITVLADTAIRAKDLDEAKANESLRAAEEARKNATSDLEIAKVEAEISALAAQLAAIKKLRGR